MLSRLREPFKTLSWVMRKFQMDKRLNVTVRFTYYLLQKQVLPLYFTVYKLFAGICLFWSVAFFFSCGGDEIALFHACYHNTWK